jgi:putative oxidoreductase
VTLGLFTRPAAFVILATMFVAGFVHHSGSPWFLPAEGAREPALLYLLGALAIVIMGPGQISLDQKFFGEKKRRF